MIILAFNGKCIGDYGQWFVNKNSIIFKKYKQKALNTYNINVNHLSPHEFLIIPNYLNEFFTKHTFKKNNKSLKTIEWDIFVDLSGATEFSIGVSTRMTNSHAVWEHKSHQKSHNGNYQLKIDKVNNKLYIYHTTTKPVNYCLQFYRWQYINKKFYIYEFDNKNECKVFIDKTKANAEKKFKKWSKRQHKKWKYTFNWYYNFINVQICKIDINYKSLFKANEINLKIKLNFQDNKLLWFIKSRKTYILINKIDIVELCNDNQKEYRLCTRIKQNVGNRFAKIIIQDVKLQMN